MQRKLKKRKLNKLKKRKLNKERKLLIMGENENLNNTIPANCPFKTTDSGLSVGCDVEHCAVGFNMSIFNPTTNKIESQLVCSLVANVLIGNQANLLIQENTKMISGLLGELSAGIAKLFMFR